MRRNFVVLFALVVLGSTVELLSTNSAFGQIVSVSPRGGVHVRAPFVRVDVGPYGGVSVRAPFAAVDVPGGYYRYGSGPYGPPGSIGMESIVPTAQEIARLDDAALLRLLRSTANRLQEELSRFDTGTRWQRYLRVPVETIADLSTPSAARREALVSTIDRLGKVAADPQYGMIAGLPAFRVTQLVMAEITSRLNRNVPAADAQSEELPPPDPSRGKTERSLLPGRTD